jgi:hypothetical protein
MARWGSYDYVLPDELLVHNMEDGGVVLWYTMGTPEENEAHIRKLEDAARGFEKVIIVPREERTRGDRWWLETGRWLQPGDQVTVTANVKSNTAPHTRVGVRFLVDGELVEELSGVIPPQRAEAADFNWAVQAGRHELRVELLSATGVKLREWTIEREF